jgi:hypothetical protein
VHGGVAPAGQFTVVDTQTIVCRLDADGGRELVVVLVAAVLAKRAAVVFKTATWIWPLYA